MDYISIIVVGIVIGVLVFVVYYFYDISEKVKNRFFEFKKEVDFFGENFEFFKKQLFEKINEFERKLMILQVFFEVDYDRIFCFLECVLKLEFFFKEKFKSLEKINVQFEYELGFFKK